MHILRNRIFFEIDGENAETAYGIGWCQINEVAKAIPDAVPLLEDQRKCNRKLPNKILPRISQYGSLPSDKQ